jgi:acyl-CoA thioesterase
MKRKKAEGQQKDPSKSTLERVHSDDAFARLVGTELVELEPGFARARLEVTDDVVNFQRMAHGGAIFTLADLACEAAGNSLGAPAVAIQTNIHFLTAGKAGDLLTATAKLTGRVESFGVIEFGVKNQEGRLLSSGQQIIAFKRQQPHPA